VGRTKAEKQIQLLGSVAPRVKDRNYGNDDYQYPDRLGKTVLGGSDSLLLKIDGFVEGVEINGGDGTAIILLRSSIEPEISLQSLRLAYSLVEAAPFDKIEGCPRTPGAGVWSGLETVAEGNWHGDRWWKLT